MAEHLGKDPKTYADEYRDFCRELRAFHDIRGYASLVADSISLCLISYWKSNNETKLQLI